jgi:hypothetical protein
MVEGVAAIRVPVQDMDRAATFQLYAPPRD